MGTQPPPLKGGRTPSPILAHFCCGQTAGCTKMPLGMELGLSPGDFVLDGDPAPLPKKGNSIWNFVPKSLLEKCCRTTSTVTSVIKVSLTDNHRLFSTLEYPVLCTVWCSASCRFVCDWLLRLGIQHGHQVLLLYHSPLHKAQQSRSQNAILWLYKWQRELSLERNAQSLGSLVIDEAS